MDAASQRGIDDIREIRDRVVLQPVEGRYKVYILDEAHQLTDAAWNALLKLIEEPPPHLVFVFCTTDLSKVLADRALALPDVRLPAPAPAGARHRARPLAEGEGIDAPPQALSLVARAARGSFRDATSTLDQLAAATENDVTVQSVLQLLGAVEEEALFRLCDLVVDRDTAGALTFVEELSEQGHDLGRLVSDLIEHLRHVLLVQHMGEVARVAARDRGDARAPARAGEPARRADRDPAARPARARRRRHAPGRRPAAPARARARQGHAARPPTSRASRSPTGSSSSSSARSPRRRRPWCRRRTARAAGSRPRRRPAAPPAPPDVELEQLQEAWARTIVPAVAEKRDPDLEPSSARRGPRSSPGTR